MRRAQSVPSLAVKSAVEHVRREVEYCDRVLVRAGVDRPRGELIALAALSYTVGHVSAPAYGYLHLIERSQSLPADAETSLRAGAGICGNAVNVFGSIVEALGLEVRRIGIYFCTPLAPGNGHSTAEVSYGEGWHWFDPTWGLFFREPGGRVLSLVEALELPAESRAGSRVGFDSLLWHQVVAAAGPDLAAETGMSFLDHQHLRVETSNTTVLYER
jgi:transglutaminase superfamily protein